ncbi:hypothetical protein CS062_03555 [Roseateles chitinivorans]|uniref:Protein CR006 P-loop domain-containing protein n=1 Tax=Roseateles chitinivorans TaxID=2917965 RepID=A0A2G9CE59_9BURK|nr:AAA family ATPase [Roseateles chitinivorans]PIM54718.1 hypothetical protein CS062_03555 [Roseateles chitinivorans]
MIKNILKISGLGVYENYSWPPGTEDFEKKNIIYGWNYSGKTTLSRVFSCLEERSLIADLQGCSFALQTDAGEINVGNISSSPLRVRVFNSDFVRENISFSGQGFKPILLLGKGSEDAQRKVEKIEVRNKDVAQAIQRIAGRINDLERSFEEAKREAARNIRQTLRIDPYTATHLVRDAASLQGKGSALRSEEELARLIEQALETDASKPIRLEEIQMKPPLLPHIRAEVEVVLRSQPSLSNTLDALKNNPALEQWIEDGVHLHQSHDHCEFCGNALDQERMHQFSMHFSKDLEMHRDEIRKAIEKVKGTYHQGDLPRIAEIYAPYREELQEALNSYSVAIGGYNQAVKDYGLILQEKLKNPYQAFEAPVIPMPLILSFQNEINSLNRIIQKHNQHVLEFESSRTKAAEGARLHFVQQFLDDQNFLGHERRAKRCASRKQRLERSVEVTRPILSELKASISQAEEGRSRINEKLRSMLGSEAVQIKSQKNTSGSDEFLLIRKGGKPARNLSDGERTAVAFAYFVVGLEDLTEDQFKDTIVFIDDPISSLDANHLFQVTASIRETFFHRVPQPNKTTSWATRCKQIFISTHNFQFFDLIRELEPTAKKEARLYFIKKISATKSVLGNMPKSLSRYSSEYHYLFEAILGFHNSQDKASFENLMMLPNAVRRFTELYTYSRIPTPRDGSVDQRAEKLFGSESAKRILKMLHKFSHGNNIESFTASNELIFDLEHTVNDLLGHIQTNDPHHWNALLEAVQP